MTSTPARQAIGIYCASGMRNSRISSNTTACTMPATGVFPPLLMFAMVRAMAPVAGIPPNSGVAMLATPCAISSVLESCLSPITPSATVADSKIDGTQYSDCNGYGEQVLYRFPIQGRHHGIRQFGTDAETVADGIDTINASIYFHQPDCHCHHDDGNK